jgi:uncharacterized membrane protein YeaQ/YmgE (transglycosylase-associated protein family)
MYPSLLGWAVIGLIAGWLSGRITRGGGFGILADLFLGLVGAVLGGWVFGLMGIHFYGFIGSLASATVGAVLLVAVARTFAHSGRW